MQRQHPQPHPDNYAATGIMDYENPLVQNEMKRLDDKSTFPTEFARAAHRHILHSVKPVYTVDEFQPVSVTLQKQKGSCSQRMACLEAMCRARKIATRVRALWISGRFWYPRFRYSRPFIPKRILLSWPQFYLEEQWVDFDELFMTTANLNGNVAGFTNAEETLFEAVTNTSVDFLGKSRQCNNGCSSFVDLSKFVLEDAGFFNTRDELYSELGSFQYSLRGRAFELIFGGRKSW
jgi:hypothetical protein